MDSERRNSFGSKESLENIRRNSRDNTEYVPTRCRITKPIPPKPATNPMQFVKIGPCELYRKAQEQLKKVEEVKSVRPEIRDEAEDWQANLDNWKSSRRKRQEHIIERVVEVKKFEQQEQEKGRRKSKTFNEILEERSKRKNKLSISLYENDDPNDFSDYGIGGPKSESGASTSDFNMNDNSSQSSAAESKNDEDICRIQTQEEQVKNDKPITSNDNCERVSNTSNDNCETSHDDAKKDTEIENTQQEPEQYTYESAIQGYRTRVISKTNLPSLPYKLSNNNNMDDTNEIGAASNTNTDVEGIISKGNILKRKELFENDKLYELNHFESSTTRRLSEDFINSQSLKERLLSLEKYTDQSIRHFDTVSTDSSDVKNNNTSKLNPDQFVRNRVTRINHLNEPDVEEECEDSTKSKSVICNNWPNKRFDSPEDDVFVNQLENKQIHRSLDNLTDSINESIALERVQSLEGLEYCHSNYPASNSSTELLAYGDTDREDSGIHTADVSCSVSQADEPVDDVVTEEEAKRTPVDNSAYPVMQFDGVFANEDFPLGPPVTALEPPKEKPPPPPVAELDALDLDESELKRLNSTKRIKKEMRLKRSSFLGIDPDLDDQPELEASIRKPPDINSFLQRESRLEKQLYKKSQSQPQTPTQSNYSEAGDSQDSGVELERGRLSSDTWCSSLAHTHSHSRQNSEPCTTNSLTSDEDEITKKEREIIELVEKEEKWRDTSNDFPACPPEHVQQPPTQHQQQEALADYITSEDDEHSEVLRVEHELLQLEREELERQRENMMFRESRARLQSKMCPKNKGMSLEDISGVAIQPHGYMYSSKSGVNYRKSMPELQREVNMASSSRPPDPNPRPPPHVVPRTPTREPFDSELCPGASKPTHPMSRHSLQMLSAAPRSRLMPQDNWIQPQPKAPVSDSREKFNYNQHWLIQEAEQRRLSAQPTANWKLSRSEKHLPDAIIQTLTQRVQNKMNLPDRNLLARNVPHSPHSVGHALPIHHPHFVMEDSPDKMLSVSGKKKCSYCGNELGRGAAMIIESLCLFYHMDCFKCCVCHVQLGDGLMGTDVRVRNNKLHCHNCYSSDDGVKFSCV